MKELIEKACHALRQADAILIRASNGLSMAEGYNIFADNEMFRSQFGSFANSLAYTVFSTAVSTTIRRKPTATSF